MPNSQFTTAEREDDETIRLVGPIEDVTADTLVRINVTVTQESGFVAQADQDIGGKGPSGFEVLARRAGGTEIDPSAPLEVVGLLTCRVEGTDQEEVFHWVDHLDADPAGEASTGAWRRREQV